LPKLKLKNICLTALEDNKAEDILALDVRKISTFADSIIIASANSNRHAKSLSEKVIENVKKNKESFLGVEGKSESGWILIDCGEVVINIMKNDIREFYDLEGLWGETTLTKKP
jgi:ribosome-associated protein|tara:strand:- start:7958 stop:8299 length:342 start_codon:yes stop_codon:yes gene_type:complete